MMKYIIATLIVIAGLAGLLLYIGDDATLLISSSATSGPLAFSPRELTWQIVIVLGMLSLFTIIGLWSLLGWLWRLPGRVKSGVGLRRRNQALDAMEDALIAGDEGDMHKSRKKAQRARALIASEDLGRIISAQAAEASGDSEEALKQYEAMLASDKTRPMGQRGLAQNMLEAGNLQAAIEQSQAAYAENKHARWAFQILFKAQVADCQWDAALETLAHGESRKHIDKAEARRRRAVLQTAQADRFHDDGQLHQSLDLARKAAQAAPEFSPGVALAAKQFVASNQEKKAASLIEKAWTQAPHPALALAFLDIQQDESDKTRKKRINGLVKHNPTHRESVLLLAEEALRQKDGVTALSLLSPLLADKPTARLCVLAAQTETALNNPADAALWMQRAATAPREADWSDLDPSGDSFDYSPQDWQRLVFSFGQTGTLIHPRAERQDVARLPSIVQPVITAATEMGSESGTPISDASKIGRDESLISQKKTAGETSDASQPIMPPNAAKVIDDNDLADRLDSLLDKPSN